MHLNDCFCVYVKSQKLEKGGYEQLCQQQELCYAHTKHKPILLSISCDLYFPCHVKTVTGVSPKAKTLYHCLPIYLCIYLLLQHSGMNQEHCSEFGTQAASLSCSSNVPTLQVSLALQFHQGINHMVLPGLGTFPAMHPCWAVWMNRRSGHAITLCNAGLATASRQCQALETISVASNSLVSDLDDLPGCVQ